MARVVARLRPWRLTLRTGSRVCAARAASLTVTCSGRGLGSDQASLLKSNPDYQKALSAVKILP